LRGRPFTSLAADKLRRVKEHLLNDGDRAALQGLIPLAGALGAGTIFALFFGGRRRGSGIAVFELFAIVAVLTAVATTAYLAIALLHRNTPVSDRELTETATPLIVAVFLLVFLSALSRLPGSAERIAALLPLALGAGFVAFWLASSSWASDPAHASLVALIILAVGALIALFVDRFRFGSDGRREQHEMARLSAAGYLPLERALAVALPPNGDPTPVLICWARKERLYVDWAGLHLLREEARRRWAALSGGKARLPVGAALVEVKIPWLGLRRTALVSTFEPGDDSPRVHELRLDSGLADVTGLGLV